MTQLRQKMIRAMDLKDLSKHTQRTYLAAVTGLANLIFADDDAKVFTRTLQSLGWEEDHIKLLMNEKGTENSKRLDFHGWGRHRSPSD